MPLCPTPNSLEQWPKKAEDFIPHSGLMCVVDDLVSVVNKIAETTAVIKKGNPFAREDGTVEEAIFVEMIAQSIAAGSGYELTEEQRSTQQGYLLGIKNMKIMGTAHVGNTLRVKAFRTAQFGDFGIIEGTVSRGDEVLASGEIKVVQMFDAKPAESLL